MSNTEEAVGKWKVGKKELHQEWEEDKRGKEARGELGRKREKRGRRSMRDVRFRGGGGKSGV